jgi:hypothetical protein
MPAFCRAYLRGLEEEGVPKHLDVLAKNVAQNSYDIGVQAQFLKEIVPLH